MTTEGKDISESLGYKLRDSSKMVISAFIKGEAHDAGNMYTDGKILHGNWVGGNDLAKNDGSTVINRHALGNISQTIHKFIKKSAIDSGLSHVARDSIHEDIENIKRIKEGNQMNSNLFNAIYNKSVEAADVFKNAIAEKLQSAINTRHEEIAQTMFKEETEQLDESVLKPGPTDHEAAKQLFSHGINTKSLVDGAHRVDVPWQAKRIQNGTYNHDSASKYYQMKPRMIAHEKGEKHSIGTYRAAGKLFADHYRKHSEALAAKGTLANTRSIKIHEDTEQLDEVSGELIGRYVQKARQDLKNKRDKRNELESNPKVKEKNDMISDLYNKREYTKDGRSKHTAKIGALRVGIEKIKTKIDPNYPKSVNLYKRNKGIETAIKKLTHGKLSEAIEEYMESNLYTPEEIKEYMQSEDFQQLDELSKDTLVSYVKKAAVNLAKNSASIEPGEIAKRKSGISTAVNKMVKE